MFYETSKSFYLFGIYRDISRSILFPRKAINPPFLDENFYYFSLKLLHICIAQKIIKFCHEKLQIYDAFFMATNRWTKRFLCGCSGITRMRLILFSVEDKFDKNTSFKMEFKSTCTENTFIGFVQQKYPIVQVH